MKFGITKLVILILTVSFFACSSGKKDEPEPTNSTDFVDEQKKYEEIYEYTGCKVKDARSIVYLKKTTDTVSNEIYLHGSRTKDSKEIFWVSKYKPDGDLIWEINHKMDGNHESTAMFFNILDAETAAMMYVTDRTSALSSQYTTETKLIIVNTKEGKISKSIDYGTTTYATIKPLINTFLVYNTELEKGVNSRAGGDVFVYDNKGNKMNYPTSSIRIPERDDVIVNDTLFISQKPFSIVSLFGAKKWISDYQLGKVIAYTVKDDVLDLQYAIGNQRDIVQYDLKANKLIIDSSPGSGNQNVVYAEIGKQYAAADDLDIVLHKIELSDNDKGTKYYKIQYSLYNNTTTGKITEGTFKIVNQNGKEIQQYGFFSYIFPGESVTNRVYEFKELSTEKMIYIQYQPSDAVPGSTKPILRWKIPS